MNLGIWGWVGLWSPLKNVGLGYRGLGFRVWGLGFRDLGFRSQGVQRIALKVIGLSV